MKSAPHNGETKPREYLLDLISEWFVIIKGSAARYRSIEGGGIIIFYSCNILISTHYIDPPTNHIKFDFMGKLEQHLDSFSEILLQINLTYY